ncbi:uncharacterized protein BP5553_00095 [Venustampulla echinocandica]|uniref:Uncharacterized protein n=1 Tax=Venustampulla echinocandica TaxID=2656787 RepID=A0A370TX61_9HELO|nr:uncharacterized protein BP5553_00095 [Venustampulla echinocandica]RDL40116.1 hypothetical protein BP5553_00095 [Venustampulla echinocandica]
MAEFTGPSPKTMIETHTLAMEVIARHNDACPIFDASELALLARFCAQPETKDFILRESDMLDEPGDAPGTRASATRGSLAGYAIARHGTDNPVLEDREIEMLRRWFETGGAKTGNSGEVGEV